jgi:hypothetical protein
VVYFRVQSHSVLGGTDKSRENYSIRTYGLHPVLVVVCWYLPPECVVRTTAVLSRLVVRSGSQTFCVCYAAGNKYACPLLN